MSSNFGDLKVRSIELFCLTAEHESFTSAASVAGLTPAAVSRVISRMELRLGVQLFVRTTRKVRLTESGKTYFLQCRQALGQLAEAERELTGTQKQAAGTVRLSLPTSYGHHRILPVLSDFQQLYPNVHLEIELSNRNVDFSAEEFDLAVRGRKSPDSSLVARKLEDANLVVIASPRYLDRAGVPTKISDLARHQCIQFLLPRTGQPVPWVFHQNGEEIEVATRGKVQFSADILGPATLARHGGGLLQTYQFIVEQDLTSGALVRVMTNFEGASRPFSLLYPSNRNVSHRVRVLIDFLLHRLSIKQTTTAELLL